MECIDSEYTFMKKIILNVCVYITSLLTITRYCYDKIAVFHENNSTNKSQKERFSKRKYSNIIHRKQCHRKYKCFIKIIVQKVNSKHLLISQFTILLLFIDLLSKKKNLL